VKAKVELALGGALNWVLRIGGGHVIEANWTGLIGTVGFVRNTHGSARARGDIVVCIQGSPRFHSMLLIQFQCRRRRRAARFIVLSYTHRTILLSTYLTYPPRDGQEVKVGMIKTDHAFYCFRLPVNLHQSSCEGWHIGGKPL
jgi:hypothetical protein